MNFKDSSYVGSCTLSHGWSNWCWEDLSRIWWGWKSFAHC